MLSSDPAPKGKAGLAKSQGMRMRVRLRREGPAGGLTHLAQIEAIRRAALGSGLPVACDGRRRRPRPRLSFGPAISVGYESHAEYFDMDLLRACAPEEVARGLSGSLGSGFRVLEVRRIPPFFPSLEATLNVVEYEVRGPFPADARAGLREFLDRREIVIEKVKDGGARIERVDARPLIRAAEFAAGDRLDLTLRFGPKRTVKPEALLRSWLGPLAPLPEFKILRKELFSETASGSLMRP